ncbi:glycosyltransferase [Cyanobium sp. ATX 6A2]|uniref:glycosyltransferase n=1 Tax=Cyanobium sp. ATX 6A2 TaxID=2823700 RepID=UPI0037C08685|nr:glycosyltransferase [Cyanobium sp. ATX 6A2]
MQKISVVSPVYQAAPIVPQLVSEVSSALEDLTDSFEIILVDDRSRDESWDAIRDS